MRRCILRKGDFGTEPPGDPVFPNRKRHKSSSTTTTMTMRHAVGFREVRYGTLSSAGTTAISLRTTTRGCALSLRCMRMGKAAARCFANGRRQPTSGEQARARRQPSLFFFFFTRIYFLFCSSVPRAPAATKRAPSREAEPLLSLTALNYDRGGVRLKETHRASARFSVVPDAVGCCCCLQRRRSARGEVVAVVSSRRTADAALLQAREPKGCWPYFSSSLCAPS